MNEGCCREQSVDDGQGAPCAKPAPGFRHFGGHADNAVGVTGTDSVEPGSEAAAGDRITPPSRFGPLGDLAQSQDADKQQIGILSA